MHIAMLTNNVLPPHEGIGRHVVEIARRLVLRGHRVTVLARGRLFAGWRSETVAGIRIERYPYLPFQPFHHHATRPLLEARLRAMLPNLDMLHVHLPMAPPLTVDCPIIATFHSPMLADTAAINERGLHARLVRLNALLVSRRHEQWYLDHAAEVLAVSRGVRDELAAGYRVPSQGVVVVENGVDERFFSPLPLAARRGRRIVYVGRLGYRKGLGRLLEAMALLDSRTTLDIAGDGPLRARLESRARALGIAGRVRWLGFLDRAGVRAALHQASCAVNPADYESGPLSLLEALATGTPIVSTATGLVRDLAEETTPPLLVAGSTPAALAATIETVFASRREAEGRAAAGRLLVERRFAWDRIVDALENVYLHPARAAA